MHGKFKVVANIEQMLMYLKNQFEPVQSQLYDNMGEDHLKLFKWHANILKPRCDVLIGLMKQKDLPDITKQKEIDKLDKLIKKMDEMLQNNNAEFFSNNDQPSVVDILLHSELSTIVYCYSTK